MGKKRRKINKQPNTQFAKSSTSSSSKSLFQLQVNLNKIQQNKKCFSCSSSEFPIFRCPEYLQKDLQNAFGLFMDKNKKDNCKFCLKCSYHIKVLAQFLRQSICVSGVRPLCFMCKNSEICEITPELLKMELSLSPFKNDIEKNGKYYSCIICLYQLREYKKFKSMVQGVHLPEGAGKHIGQPFVMLRKLKILSEHIQPMVLLNRMEDGKSKRSGKRSAPFNDSIEETPLPKTRRVEFDFTVNERNRKMSSPPPIKKQPPAKKVPPPPVKKAPAPVLNTVKKTPPPAKKAQMPVKKPLPAKKTTPAKKPLSKRTVSPSPSKPSRTQSQRVDSPVSKTANKKVVVGKKPPVSSNNVVPVALQAIKNIKTPPRKRGAKLPPKSIYTSTPSIELDDDEEEPLEILPDVDVLIKPTRTNYRRPKKNVSFNDSENLVHSFDPDIDEEIPTTESAENSAQDVVSSDDVNDSTENNPSSSKENSDINENLNESTEPGETTATENEVTDSSLTSRDEFAAPNETIEIDDDSDAQDLSKENEVKETVTIDTKNSETNAKNNEGDKEEDDKDNSESDKEHSEIDKENSEIEKDNCENVKENIIENDKNNEVENDKQNEDDKEIDENEINDCPEEDQFNDKNEQNHDNTNEPISVIQSTPKSPQQIESQTTQSPDLDEFPPPAVQQNLIKSFSESAFENTEPISDDEILDNPDSPESPEIENLSFEENARKSPNNNSNLSNDVLGDLLDNKSTDSDSMKSREQNLEGSVGMEKLFNDLKYL